MMVDKEHLQWGPFANFMVWEVVDYVDEQNVAHVLT